MCPHIKEIRTDYPPTGEQTIKMLKFLNLSELKILHTQKDKILPKHVIDALTKDIFFLNQHSVSVLNEQIRDHHLDQFCLILFA